MSTGRAMAALSLICGIGLASPGTAAQSDGSRCASFGSLRLGLAVANTLTAHEVLADAETMAANANAANRRPAANWLRLSRWRVDYADAVLAMVRGDERTFAPLAAKLDQAAADLVSTDRAPRGEVKGVTADQVDQVIWMDVLQLYVFAFDQGFESISPDVVARILTRLDEETGAKRDPVRAIATVLSRVALGQNGEASDAGERFRSPEPLTEQYVRAFAEYLVGDTTNNLAKLRSAADAFDRIRPGDAQSPRCASGIGPLAALYAGAARLSAARVLANAKAPRPQIQRELDKGLDALTIARGSLDPLQLPGLWIVALRRSADVYERLEAYALTPDDRQRFASLHDEAERFAMAVQ